MRISGGAVDVALLQHRRDPIAAILAKYAPLGLLSTTSQLLFAEDWDDLAAWTVADTNGSIGVAGNVVTLSNTSGGVNLLHQDTAWQNETEPYAIEFDWDYGSGNVRCSVGSGITVQAFINISGTTLTIAGSDLSAETVTPANFAAGERHRAIIVIDPTALQAHFFLLHLPTSGTEQYTFLGTKSIAAKPYRMTFLIGSAAGGVIVYPIRIWRVWGVTIGDSLSAGSPDYSPVPRSEASPDVTSQVAYWIEQDQAGSKRCLNFGKGGQGFAHVQALDGPIVTAGFKVAFVWVGTNNISGGMSLADMQTNALDVMTVLRTGGVLPVMMGIAPRPNYSDPATMNAKRNDYNNWLRSIVYSQDAVFIDVAAIVADPSDPDDLLPEYNADEVHLTVAGYHAVADEVMRVLRAASRP